MALSGCSSYRTDGVSSGQRAEMQRIIKVVGDAIVDPRQDSAAGLGRAAESTRAGTDGRLQVLSATDLDDDDLSNAQAELVWRIHLDASDDGFHRTSAATACFKVKFSYYELLGAPDEVRCPAQATALPPRPGAGSSGSTGPQTQMPARSQEALKKWLAGLPVKVPDAFATPFAVLAALPQQPAGSLPPQVQAKVLHGTWDGDVVMVSLWSPDTRECLLGSRIGKDVAVAPAGSAYTAPGEGGCGIGSGEMRYLDSSALAHAGQPLPTSTR